MKAAPAVGFSGMKTRGALKLLVALNALLFLLRPAFSQTHDLTQMSIEDLMNIQVTSVSKKAEHLSESAAAIFVITNDDIRKSGVTNIPDALRMVPGLNVARIDSNKWAVNSRSSTSRTSDKLLVLIDGRSVYTNYFSGVYWEVQNVMLEDIDRIEVIRGPGATLWGANAVNGVINIITKSAEDTQGTFLSAGGGTIEKRFGDIRYGGRIGKDAHYRIYAKGFKRDAFESPDGGDAGDAWDLEQGGVRFDSEMNARDLLTIQGDVYRGDIDQRMDLPMLMSPYTSTVNDDTDVLGGNLLARWQRTLSSTSDLTYLAYYDRSQRQEAWADQKRDTLNMDLQHNFNAGERNKIVWGLRYCRIHDEFKDTSILSLDPASNTDHLVSAFLQDEIALVGNRLWLTLGAKLEHNDYTGFEVQPSGRLFWDADKAHKFWAALSRAVRTPSRMESGGKLVNEVIPPSDTFSLPVALTVVGNDNFDAETLIAYEMGYRFLPNPIFSIDLALFYNDYENLRGADAGTPVLHDTYVEFPLVVVNGYATHTYGAEAAVGWLVRDWLKLDLAYSYLECNLEESYQFGRAPKHQVSFRSAVKLHTDVDLDIWLRYVDDATAVNADTPDYYYPIDDYVALDIRLACRPSASLELAIVGQSLLESRHMEFAPQAYTRPTEIPRSVYGKITFRF